MTTERRPILKKRSSGKFKMHPFQREDLMRLSEQNSSANWSEMGCMKTTTAEWLMELKLRNIPNPRVLVITTKSGKGTYYESLPEVLPNWDVFTVSTRRNSIVVGSKPVPVDVELPDPLYMRPVVVLAHYHCFTDRSCMPQQKMKMIELPNGEEMKVPILKEDGTFDMNIPRLNILMRSHWDMVIIDEAHRIKNQDSQWTRNIKKIKVNYKHLMTGTGFINNPAEIWSLLNWLYPDVYTGYNKFREHFCDEDEYGRIVGILPQVEDEFRELVQQVGVRRRMLESFPNIKEPIETVVPVDLNPTQRKMYNEILENLSTLDAAGEPLHSPNVLSMLNRLRQICVATPLVTEDRWDYKLDRRIIKVKLVETSSKLDACMELIQGMEWDTENKDQVVVFSNFRDPLELLKPRLDNEFISYLHLRSEMTEKDRYEMWHNTWPEKRHQVFLCTLGVGSESINLSSAHRAIFLDQSWSPKDNSQAVGRIYRPGQTGAAQIIYIRAAGTVDYRIVDANNTKIGWFKQIFGIKDVDADDEDFDGSDD